jgi:hypothetical protein
MLGTIWNKGYTSFFPTRSRSDDASILMLRDALLLALVHVRGPEAASADPLPARVCFAPSGQSRRAVPQQVQKEEEGNVILHS